jgi:hypothetical protein
MKRSMVLFEVFYEKDKIFRLIILSDRNEQGNVSYGFLKTNLTTPFALSSGFS